jgi:uncharacterized protein (DUF362 family)
MPVIILEGVQGVGKSALLEQLAKENKVTVVDFKRTYADNPEQYIRMNTEKTRAEAQRLINMSADKAHHIVDRFVASELVFGQIAKRKQDYDWIEELEHEMSHHQILTAYIYADYNFIMKNVWSSPRRGPYIADMIMANIPAALDLYSKYLDFTPVKFISFYNNCRLSIQQNAQTLWFKIMQKLYGGSLTGLSF